MESAQNVLNDKKRACHDCGQEITIDNKEIKNGFLLCYKDEGKDFLVFKCRDCFRKSPELRNYKRCEVYSRIVGYLRPVQQWNRGKQEEFNDRKEFKPPKECC